jgi:hypothetical protein
MTRVLIDMRTCIAIIEPSSEIGQPFVTLLRDDEGVANSFVLDCNSDDLELFALAILQALEQGREDEASKDRG